LEDISSKSKKETLIISMRWSENIKIKFKILIMLLIFFLFKGFIMIKKLIHEI